MDLNRAQRRKLEAKVMRENNASRENAKKLVYLSEVRDKKSAPDLPDGTAVKIDAAKCLAVKGDSKKNPKYVEFIQANRGKVFHVSRDDPKATSTIVVLEEDESTPRWLWWCGDLIVIKEEPDEEDY